MKYFYLILILTSLNIYYQNSDKIKYTGGELYMISTEYETKKKIFSKPIGKVLFVTYNKFYKTYLIAYNYMGKGVTFMEFDYLEDINNQTKLMKEESYGNFYVIDDIINSGILIMTKTEVQKSKYENSILTFKITGINLD